MQAAGVCISCPRVTLQPANVLVDAAGHACLSDLGLSTFVSNPAMRASLLEKMRTASDAASGPTNHSMPDLRRCAVEVNGHVVRPYIRGRAGTPGYWAPGEKFERPKCSHCMRRCPILRASSSQKFLRPMEQTEKHRHMMALQICGLSGVLHMRCLRVRGHFGEPPLRAPRSQRSSVLHLSPTHLLLLLCQCHWWGDGR